MEIAMALILFAALLVLWIMLPASMSSEETTPQMAETVFTTSEQQA